MLADVMHHLLSFIDDSNVVKRTSMMYDEVINCCNLFCGKPVFSALQSMAFSTRLRVCASRSEECKCALSPGFSKLRKIAVYCKLRFSYLVQSYYYLLEIVARMVG